MRALTKEEEAKIIQKNKDAFQDEVDLSGHTTVAIDNYITDGPGYSGTLYMVIFSGCSTFYQMFDKDFEPVVQGVEMKLSFENKEK